jgi:galactonate dehydratase
MDGVERLKIERIEPFLVDRWLLIRVYTDDDLVGTGEAGLWAHQKMVYEAIRELSRYFVGKDPRLIEHHWQAVSRNTHFMGSVLSAALSAIDIALWDLLGKSVNIPVYQLLGGKCRDKVRVFATVRGETVEQLAESAENQVKDGFTALRVTPFFRDAVLQTPTKVVNTAVEMVQAIRDAIGYDVDLGVELHRRLTPSMAILLAKQLEPYRLLFYEDPVGPESVEALAYVAAHVNIPICAGERKYNIQQFQELLPYVSYIRPDVTLAGGITHCKKIAALAEASFVGVLPHLMGGPVNTPAQVQLDAVIPNYVLHEAGVLQPPYTEIVDEPITIERGYMLLPNRPGIGVEIQEDVLEKYPYRPSEIRAVLHEDGSIAEK